MEGRVYRTEALYSLWHNPRNLSAKLYALTEHCTGLFYSKNKTNAITSTIHHKCCIWYVSLYLLWGCITVYEQKGLCRKACIILYTQCLMKAAVRFACHIVIIISTIIHLSSPFNTDHWIFKKKKIYIFNIMYIHVRVLHIQLGKQRELCVTNRGCQNESFFLVVIMYLVHLSCTL